MPTEIKTDAKLLARLAASTKTKASKARLRKQRVSFIYGALPSDSTITRDQIESVLGKLEA
ncbi:hypothetical protein LZ518_08480 [Sphingomonas sp. RB56-2]|uniref:Uncharacterized protein n=1 Tax=Sphingomonas brevis TaxID=2908206 RepID=A0ABT0S9T0_9SPHN|nr:hypothetical protein [Sphingomonas brevis]MCL6741165.1 hypothetical protein [Sphingomonas brevis]